MERNPVYGGCEILRIRSVRNIKTVLAFLFRKHSEVEPPTASYRSNR
jgi:hypothetical protein